MIPLSKYKKLWFDAILNSVQAGLAVTFFWEGRWYFGAMWIGIWFFFFWTTVVADIQSWRKYSDAANTLWRSQGWISTADHRELKRKYLR